MTYRAAAVPQRDGSPLANQNCRMASAATGLDYQTNGRDTTTGAQMRASQDDQDGGTDSADAVTAWARGWHETLTVRDGHTFADALADLDAGRLVHLDTWHAAVGGPCLSGTGRYGHTIAVAPERNGSRWLVSDPWCLPAKWVWWEEDKLRAGAEQWGIRVASGTAGPREAPAFREAMGLTARKLMTEWYPGHEAPPDEPETETLWAAAETAGPVRIMFTATDAHGGSDMAMAAAAGIDTAYTCRVTAGQAFYADADLTERIGDIGKDATVTYVGAPIGEASPARAIVVNTGIPYPDKVARLTIVYVPAAACSPVADKPVPLPPSDIEARDKEWREWLLAGSPGSE